MTNILSKKHYKFLLNMLLLISIVSVSFIFSISYGDIHTVNRHEIMSMTISLIFGVYLIKKDFIIKTINNATRFELIISFIMTILAMNELRCVYDLNNASNYILSFLMKFHITKLTKIFTKIFAMIFLYLLILYLIKILIKFISSFIKDLTKDEIKVIKISMLILSIIIFVTYSTTDNIYKIYDNVFSLDSYYVGKEMYGKIFWQLDIRHILFSPITMLFKISISPIMILFDNSSPYYYILLAIFNALLLVTISIMLKKLTNNKWVMYIYLASYPVLQYSLLIEKYQICAFFLVLFFYSKYYKNDNKIEDLALLSAVGTMSTSAFIGLFSGEKIGNKSNCGKSLILGGGIFLKNYYIV